MEKMNNQYQHWTSSSIDNFVFQIAADFTLQLERKLESEEMNNKDLANLLNVTDGRVSQVFNNPGNFKLRTMAEFARALGMKVAVVAYADGDPHNHRGPINSDIFYECWKKVGSPQDFSDLRPSNLIFCPQYNSQPLEAVNDNEKKQRLSIVPLKASTAVA